jgi:Flp pilus assembly protein TadD
MFFAQTTFARGSRLLGWVLVAVTTVLLAVAVNAEDKTVRLRLPKRNKPTPVQKLNRDGVKALSNHQYDKARKLFYRAYLLDPNDPFTLNNLGYVSEIQGDVGRAQRYYDLAQQQASDAAIDLATAKNAEGKPVSAVAGKAADKGLEIVRMNMAAISLLAKDRTPEADLMLQKALSLDPHNPFTLNNMGYTKEKEGELEAALDSYSEAARLGSKEPVVVTVNKEWRGRAISEVAAENAEKVRKQLEKAETPAARVARLNLKGVSAMNRNDHAEARKDFEAAYKIDPQDAFTLNNMGFLAELDGDRESADFYYEKAREAKRRKEKVTVATRREVEGQQVGRVAETSTEKVEARMQQEVEKKRQQGGPIELRRRVNAEPGATTNPNQGTTSPSPAEPQPIPALTGDEASPQGSIAAPANTAPGE